ncbi:MAG TPA: phenylalanine--tRNA ligase subunit beta [Armatimonadetes bacterium]|nr:phenylalanine--tRNA ligase subunit beta [Armatimonadota bacterium]
MRIPLSWLREFVAVDMDVNELAHKLEMAGLGVEAIDEFGGDVVFDLEITPNRGDCLSVLGVAREVTAITGERLRMPQLRVNEEADDIANHAKVIIEDEELCPRYSARLITGIRVGESPQWLQQRLEACGQSPINNIVDVTNYVMFEFGQPLHAFDFHTLREGTIIVRRAKPTEQIVTLDEELRALTDDMLVIADAHRPVAIAGVMGGLETEVTSSTTTVLLESAHFLNKSIRRTAKQLNMRTEASYRFERWVDPNGTVRALDRAAQLIIEIAGGQVHRGVIDVYPKPIEPKRVTVRASRARRLLGIDIALDEVRELLMRLGFNITQLDDDTLQVVVPTWRNDIEREADLIEEVARLYGYERIPMTLPRGIAPQAGESASRRTERWCKDILTRLGLNEVVTFSLTHQSAQDAWRADEAGAPLTVRNPLVQDYSMLRTSMLPSLLSVVERNMRRGELDVWIFELGKVYKSKGMGQLPDEHRRLCIAIAGQCYTSHWNLPPQLTSADFFALKGIIEQLLAGMGVEGVKFKRTTHSALHPYQSAEVCIGDESIGIIGRVHPELERERELRGAVYVAELNFDAIASRARRIRTFQPLPAFPATLRDIAIIVPEDAEAMAVENIIREVGGELIEAVMAFDEYRSEQIGVGRKSIAFSITFRAPDRTLSGEEVDALMEQIRNALRERMNAQIRQ